MPSRVTFYSHMHARTQKKKTPSPSSKVSLTERVEQSPLTLRHRSLLVNPPRCDSTNNASSPERPCVCLKYGCYKEGSNVHKAPETIQGGPAGLSNTLTHRQCIDHRLRISCASPWTSTISQPTSFPPLFFLCRACKSSFCVSGL